jgi:hypothetical protein
MTSARDPAPIHVHVRRAEGEKCLRCWRILPEVTAPKFLCDRCDEAVQALDSTAAPGPDRPGEASPTGDRGV